jgi:broad-specificity NMP kinase
MDKLNSEINRMVHASKADYVIVEGHLLCDMRIDGAVAIVIRERLATILKRLKKRGYSKQKIEDDIVSEGIDYCGVRAANYYRVVYEIGGWDGALGKAIKIAEGKKVKVTEIEMLGELNGLLGKL